MSEIKGGKYVNASNTPALVHLLPITQTSLFHPHLQKGAATLDGRGRRCPHSGSPRNRNVMRGVAPLLLLVQGIFVEFKHVLETNPLPVNKSPFQQRGEREVGLVRINQVRKAFRV